MNSHNAAIPLQAQEAAARGDIIRAIKITREATGLGLKEAKDAVEAHIRGVRGRTAAADAQLPAGAIAALHQGHLIEAVKLTRQATGLGLKDSKEAVEHYLATHPMSLQQFRTAGGDRSGVGRLILLIVVVVTAAAAMWWLMG